MRTRNGALADIFPQQPARDLDIPRAWSEQSHINSTRGPQRGPCVFLGHWSWHWPCHCSYWWWSEEGGLGRPPTDAPWSTQLFISEFQPEFQKAPLLKFTGQGSEPKRQQHGTRERSKFPPCSWVQISAQPLSSDVKSGKWLISLNPSIFICWVGSRVRIILSTSEIIKCIWST